MKMCKLAKIKYHLNCAITIIIAMQHLGSTISMALLVFKIKKSF